MRKIAGFLLIFTSAIFSLSFLFILIPQLLQIASNTVSTNFAPFAIGLFIGYLLGTIAVGALIYFLFKKGIKLIKKKVLNA